VTLTLNGDAFSSSVATTVGPSQPRISIRGLLSLPFREGGEPPPNKTLGEPGGSLPLFTQWEGGEERAG